MGVVAIIKNDGFFWSVILICFPSVYTIVHFSNKKWLVFHMHCQINEGIEPTVHAMFLRRHQTKDNKWVDEKAAAANVSQLLTLCLFALCIYVVELISE